MTANDERRAEVEAVARAMSRQGYGYDIDTPSMLPDKQIKAARQIIEALDRVRDARGDDEALRRLSQSDQEMVRRLADGEDPWTVDPEYGCTNPLTGYFPSAEVAAEKRRRATRSPQGEDHEAGDWVCPTCGGSNGHFLACSAFPAALSPSRDGTVAVEDVVSGMCVQRMRSLLAEAVRLEYGAPEWLERIGAALAEFARPATGEQTDHGG